MRPDTMPTPPPAKPTLPKPTDPSQQVSSPQPPLTVDAAQTRALDPQSVATAAQQILTALTQPSETLETPPANPVLQGYLDTYDNDPTTNPSGSGVSAILNAYRAPQQETVGTGGDTLEEKLLDQRAQRETALDHGRGENREARIINQLRKLNEHGSSVYDMYTPTQKAAVDFNRMLLQAVHKDRKANYNPDDLQRTAYNDAVDEVLGGNGSDTYAPETLALLKQIGYSDPSADLDDFLSLKAGIGRKNIVAMADHQAPAPAAPGVETAAGLSPLASPLEQERFALAKDLAHTTEAIEPTIAQGNKLLSTIIDTAQVDRGDLLDKFGGEKTKFKGGAGYEPAGQLDENGNAQDLNTYFQQAFDMLASKKVDPDVVLGDARSVLSPGSLHQFMTYLNDRSSYSERYGLPLGEGEGYRSPDEFRQLLGLDKGE